MSSTLLRVLPLALGGAISPVILLVQITTLATRSHRVARSLIVLGSNVLVVAVIMVVVAIGGDRTSPGTGGDDPTSTITAWIRIVLSILLLATALRMVLEQRHEAAAEPEISSVSTSDTAADQPLRPMRFFLLGLGAMVSNATTIVLLIPAVHEIAIADLRTSEALVLYGIIGVIVMLPSYLPLVVFAALGRRGPAVMNRFGDWLHAHQKTIGIVVSLGFALYLGWTGFTGLS